MKMTPSARSPFARLRTLAAICGLACASLTVHAEELQFHGFLGQSLIHTSANNFFGKTANSASLEYTEMGANLSYKALPGLLFSGQVLARHAGQTEEPKLRLDYAFAQYTPIADEDTRISVGLGKAKFAYGFYNDTRDTPATRPGILLPESIYFDRARAAFQAATGIHLAVDRTFGADTLGFRLAAGKNDVSERNIELAFLEGDRPGYLNDTRGAHWQVLYDHDGGRLRLAYSHSAATTQYRPAAGDFIRPGHFERVGEVLSAQINDARWSITAEYAQRPVTYFGFGPLMDFRSVGESAYLEGTWRFSPDWDGFVRYDVFYFDRSDRDGSAYAARTKRPAYQRYAKDWTVGARYRFAPGWHVAGEFHAVDGLGWLPPADNWSGSWQTGSLSPDAARRWNMLLMQLSYQF